MIFSRCPFNTFGQLHFREQQQYIYYCIVFFFLIPLIYYNIWGREFDPKPFVVQRGGVTIRPMTSVVLLYSIKLYNSIKLVVYEIPTAL